MHNYQERITIKSNGKPFKLVPYVTFFESDAEEIMAFMRAFQPDVPVRCERTACIWVKKASPIQEINQLPAEQLQGLNRPC